MAAVFKAEECCEAAVDEFFYRLMMISSESQITGYLVDPYQGDS